LGLNLGKSKGRRTLDKVEGFATCIGEGTHFSGKLKGDGHCIIHGYMEGDCDLNGTLVIGEKGHWVGDILAQNVLIAGQIEGNVTAKEKIEIISTARVKGTISSKVMAIAEGAIHEGNVHMSSSSKQPTHFKDKREPGAG
jgi:cytoskeletal protein CcmA (bactofilin family)